MPDEPDGDAHYRFMIGMLVRHRANTIAPHRALLASITASGGSVAISLALPGSIDIGARVTARDTARLAALGIDLDIEVFPHTGNFA